MHDSEEGEDTHELLTSHSLDRQQPVHALLVVLLAVVSGALVASLLCVALFTGAQQAKSTPSPSSSLDGELMSRAQAMTTLLMAELPVAGINGSLCECDCPCDDGPYFFTPKCYQWGEGLGSKMLHFADGLLVAGMTGLQWLSAGDCFTTDHDFFDYASWMGLQRTPRCDACSLVRRISSHVQLNNSLAAYNGDWYSTCLKVNWRETAALREPIFPCYSAHRHLFAGAVIDTMYHTINRAEPANRSKIIFIGPPIRSSDDGGDYGLYQQRGGACFRDWLWTKYESAFIQQTNASSYRSSDAVVAARPRLPFVPDRINIGLHFRWGDVKTSDPDQPDWRQTFNLAWAAQALQSIINHPAFRDRTDVWFFSEGDNSTFLPVQSAVPSVRFRLGQGSHTNPSVTREDLDVMAHCDVLIGGQSAFYLLATNMLGPDAIFVASLWHYKWADYGTNLSNTSALELQDLTAEHLADKARQLDFFRGRHQRFMTYQLYNETM